MRLVLGSVLLISVCDFCGPSAPTIPPSARLSTLRLDAGTPLGRSVALSGQALAVSAQNGAIVLVNRDGGWLVRERLTVPGFKAAERVALSGDTLAMANNVAVALFERTDAGWA